MKNFKHPYGRTSQGRLDTCHDDIQMIWGEIAKYINTTVLCGHREEAEQNSAFESNHSKVQWPNSTHNSLPSMGIDSAPWIASIRNVDYNDYKALSKFAGFILLIAIQLFREGKTTHLIKWGGDWDMDGRTIDQTFNDLVHFELYKP